MEREFDELEGLAKGLERLLEEPKQFEKVVEAVKNHRVEEFREILENLKIYRYCVWICRWICIVHRRLVCDYFCRELELVEWKFDRVMEFAKVTVELTRDRKAFNGLIEAFRKQDKKLWNNIILERKYQPFCIVICRWIYYLECFWICRRMCI